MKIDITNIAEYYSSNEGFCVIPEIKPRSDKINESDEPLYELPEYEKMSYQIDLKKINNQFPYQMIPFNSGKIFFKIPASAKPWNYTIEDIFQFIDIDEGKFVAAHEINIKYREKTVHYFMWRYVVEKSGELCYDDEDCYAVNEIGEEILDVDYTKTMQNSLTKILNIIRFAVSLMNMKNIEYVDEPNKALKEFQNKKKFKNNPKTIYKVLTITPIKKILSRDGQIESNGIIKALHLCRGHFREYTEDKKLFGKISGRFWISPHTRGNIKSGEVIKDYKVLAS